VPPIKDLEDDSMFPELSDDEEGGPLRHTAPRSTAGGFKGEELPFIGYSFHRGFSYPGSSSHDPAKIGARPSLARTNSTSSVSSRVLLSFSCLNETFPTQC